MADVTFKDLKGLMRQNWLKKIQNYLNLLLSFNSVKFARETVSNAGPYKLKEWVANQSVIFEKKENYWAEGSSNPALQAFPERIVFHVIPDETSSLTQLKEGNIDLLTNTNISGGAFFDLKANEVYADKFQFITEELMKFYYIAINK